jgi:hypothetical protein
MSNTISPPLREGVPYTVEVTQKGTPTIVTARVEVTDKVTAAQAIAFLNSPGLRNQIYVARHKWDLTGFGISNVSGGARPDQPVGAARTAATAYVRDFKFTPGL